MPSFARAVGYTLAGIPAAIGVGFVARYACATSDTAIDGASNAFLFGMIAAGAYAGPAFALMVGSRGRKGAAVALGLLTMLAAVANWSHTLGAIAHRGAATEAVQAKARSAIKDDREALKWLEEQRAALSFSPTTAEAVAAAQAAVSAATNVRAAECERRGPNCRMRETEEKAALATLVATLANKAATDEAAELDSKVATVRARLASAPAVESGNALGDVLGRFLNVSAITASNIQQGFVSAIVELLIAAALALPELLRSKARVAKLEDEPLPDEPREVPTPVVERIVPARPAVLVHEEVAGKFMLACLTKAKGSETPAGAIYARYQQWCEDQSLPKLAPSAFAEQFATRCKRAGIRSKRADGLVYCMDVEIVA